ncbi:MAG TPA: hypothetical protein VEA38_24850, partial [Terriglobales bacterium]|nr:hypothetical protein [Terriglobales bacterium]
MTRAALAPRALVRRAVDWWALRGRRLLRLWSMGIMACVIVNVASVAGYFESSQARAMDFLLQLRGEKPATEVVVVAVDDPAFARLQERQ